jgi:hypothetical protein
MTVSLLCYLIAVALFVVAALGWRPGQAVPLGLAAFTLGHCLAGVAFKGA